MRNLAAAVGRAPWAFAAGDGRVPNGRVAMTDRAAEVSAVDGFAPSPVPVTTPAPTVTAGTRSARTSPTSPTPTPPMTPTFGITPHVPIFPHTPILPGTPTAALPAPAVPETVTGAT